MALTLTLQSYWMLIVTFIAVHGTMTDAVITEHPSTVVAALNSNVSFTCSGYRYIIWKVDSLQIISDMAQTVLNADGIFGNIEDQNSSLLFVLASLRNNNTRIQCFVRVEQSDFLSSELSEVAYLYVYGFPHPPFNLEITRSGVDLSLSWEAPFSLDGENITYIVRVTNTRSRESRELESDSPQLVFSESIGERDCSLYEFRVYSVNPVGRSTTSIHDTIRIPTEPLTLQSADIFVNISLEYGLLVTLSFVAPKPCSSYQVISYNVTFIDENKSDSGLSVNSSAASLSVQYHNNFDSVLLIIDNRTSNIEPDKAYLVTIEAENMAGSSISQPVEVYTTGLQSSSVVLEVNDTASVTCNFALGSDALGCEVSFYVSTSMELLFAQNITREPSSGNTLTKNIPLMGSLNGSIVNITVLTSEWKFNGAVSSIHIRPQVFEADSNPDKTTASPTMTFTTQMTDESLPSVFQPTKTGSNGAVYTIIGWILGSFVVVLLLCVTVVVFGIIVVMMKKRRGSRLTDGYGKKRDDAENARSANSYVSRDGSNSPRFASSLPEDNDPLYSVIIEPKSSQCDDPYVLMQSTANETKIQLFTATNPIYTDGIESDKATAAYEEIKLAQEKGKTSPTQEGPVIYDEVKLDLDGVKLRGNESYGAVGTINT